MYLVLKSTDSNREAVRDRFLLSLLYESGARINEVLSLKLLDIKAASNGELHTNIGQAPSQINRSEFNSWRRGY